MKYSFRCCIKTNNEGIRNAFVEVVPIVSDKECDSRLFGGDYLFSPDLKDEDGVKVIKCVFRFNSKSERDAFSIGVKGLSGIIQACDSGSFIMEYKCYYDEGLGQEPYIETIVRKS